MSTLRWQWRLANRGVVTAVIDPNGVETVSQDTRVLSEAPRGTRSEGHVVVVSAEGGGAQGGSERPPLEAVVTFDPHQPICVLRVDGHEVAPSVWPVRERNAASRSKPASTGTPVGMLVLYALVAVAIVSGVVFLVARHQDGAGSIAGELAGLHRSPSGLFIAHFPGDFEAKAAVLPSGIDGIVLQEKAKSTAIVITAIAADPALARDPWAVQQRLRDEALANLPKGAARFEESARRDETCFGAPGAAVIGQLKQTSATSARVWSCAFSRGASSYLVPTMVAESASTEDHKRARTIVDATEITRLGELGTLEPAR